MQPLEPFLHMLNLRGAFLGVPSYGTPDWLRVSLELEHDNASLVTEYTTSLFKTAQCSTRHMLSWIPTCSCRHSKVDFLHNNV